MRRRTFLASAGLVGGSGAMLGAGLIARPTGSDGLPPEGTKPATVRPLTAPPSGAIPVAVVVSTGVTVIDFCGPWEVFQDVHVPSRGMSMDEQMPFRLFTVSSSTAPVRGSGGLAVVPDYTFETAPSPKVVVVPAQGGGSPAMYEWLRKVTESTDVTMSVCTGAFILAKAGLLAGKNATTHHDFFDDFAARFPDVHLFAGCGSSRTIAYRQRAG